jgi:hypothetical protein
MFAPQRDAMLLGGVDPAGIYEDVASGHRDDWPGFAAFQGDPARQCARTSTGELSAAIEPPII